VHITYLFIVQATPQTGVGAIMWQSLVERMG